MFHRYFNFIFRCCQKPIFSFVSGKSSTQLTCKSVYVMLLVLNSNSVVGLKSILDMWHVFLELPFDAFNTTRYKWAPKWISLFKGILYDVIGRNIPYIPFKSITIGRIDKNLPRRWMGFIRKYACEKNQHKWNICTIIEDTCRGFRVCGPRRHTLNH